MNTPLRIGIIGCGRISAGHILGIGEAHDGVVTALCDIDEEKLREKGDALHIPAERRFRDYHDLIDCLEVDAVEICTPNDLHVPMAAAVIRAGKPVNIEKPLTTTCAALAPVEEALRERQVPNMMCFSYRFMPAVRFAKEIVDKGLLGNIITAQVEYLQSGAFIEGRRLEWRFDKPRTGTGAIGDLGVHLIDMTRYLLGDFRAVCGRKGIVVKQRRKLDSEELAPVTADDYAMFLADLECGVTASFTVTRCAIGHSNTIRYDLFGTEGVLSFNLNDPTVLGVCLGEVDRKTGGLHTVKVPPQYRASQEQTFIDLALGRCREPVAGIPDGIACQRILDAIDRSSNENTWISVEKGK